MMELNRQKEEQDLKQNELNKVEFRTCFSIVLYVIAFAKFCGHQTKTVGT